MMYKIMYLICGEEWQAENITIERRKPTDMVPYERFIRAFHRWSGTSPSMWRKQKHAMQHNGSRNWRGESSESRISA